jgi:hypothetical protein
VHAPPARPQSGSNPSPPQTRTPRNFTPYGVPEGTSDYSPEKLTRLTAVKTAYDPDNVFHLNHNIKPVRH